MGRRRSCECGTCQKCRHRVYMAEYYARNPQKLADQRRRTRQRWADDPEGMRAYDRARYRQGKARTQTPQAKRRASDAVRAALKSGALVKEACLFCGSEIVEAHHHDYSRPLVVTWLCRRHHRLVHRLVEPF